MVGAWDYAQTILERLPSFAAVSHPAIASGLCKLIHTTVEPLYRRWVMFICFSLPVLSRNWLGLIFTPNLRVSKLIKVIFQHNKTDVAHLFLLFLFLKDRSVHDKLALWPVVPLLWQ